MTNAGQNFFCSWLGELVGIDYKSIKWLYVIQQVEPRQIADRYISVPRYMGRNIHMYILNYSKNPIDLTEMLNLQKD